MAYQDSKRKYFSTKIFIRPDQWDNKHRLINRKHPQMEEFNSQIEEMIKKLGKMANSHKIISLLFILDSILRNYHE